MPWFHLGRHRQESVAMEAPPPCPHVALTPYWDAVTDIGIEERACRFTCIACGAEFTPVEARAMRESEAERLRRELQQT